MTWRAICAWPDPSALFEALGTEVVKRKAGEGDREAQWSLGYRLVRDAAGGRLVREAAGGAGMPLGAGGRSPKAEVGLALCTDSFPFAHQTEMRRGHLMTK